VIKFYENVKPIYCSMSNGSPDYPVLKGKKEHFNYERSNFRTHKDILGWVPVAHMCNPSYSGERDEEDNSLKPARANSL
jgi:hypothetical protein